jgi:hypothetical protein
MEPWNLSSRWQGINPSGDPARVKDLKEAAIDGWRRVCLVSEIIKTVCADTALRGNQM